MKTAVLVIDVQQGLCEGEGKAFDCDGLITRINLVTSKARLAGAPVIFIQHESTAGYLEHGSADWKLAHGLVVSTSDIKVRKTTPDSFLRTDLETLLRSRGIEHVVICGMHSEFCIDPRRDVRWHWASPLRWLKTATPLRVMLPLPRSRLFNTPTQP